MARNLHACFTKIKSPPSTPPANLSRPLNNFNSLYQNNTNDSDSDDETASAAAADFATAFNSRRFFFSSPGRSNSIIDSSSSLASTSSSSLNRRENDAVSSGSGGVAVPTYSPDPYLDFRRSMQEMVEARGIRDVRDDWDYLHQLLMCYLSLNPKSTHKFIVGAFADLIVGLMTLSRRKKMIRDGKRQISR